MRTSLLSLLLILTAWSLEAAGEPFDECGHFTHPFECRFFINYSNCNPYTIRTELSVPLDSIVRIQGEVGECTPDCEDPIGYECVEITSIEPCPPTDFGAGIWVGNDYGKCEFWRSQDHGEFYLLNYFPHEYEDGEPFHVWGHTIFYCGTLCLPRPGLFVSMVSDSPPDSLDPVERLSWGELKRRWGSVRSPGREPR